jgi:HPt (histidine-containing phosphotransfer) domain-containing protein
MEQSAEPATAHEVTRAALTDTAHALVSTAGLFGFSALSATARRFEQAIAADSENAALARQLCEETRAGLALLNSLLPENRMQTEHRLQAEQRLHAEPAARTEPRHAPADLDEGSAWWR